MLLWFMKLQNSGCESFLCFHLYGTRQQLNFLDAYMFRRERLLPDPQTKSLPLIKRGSKCCYYSREARAVVSYPDYRLLQSSKFID